MQNLSNFNINLSSEQINIIVKLVQKAINDKHPEFGEIISSELTFRCDLNENKVNTVLLVDASNGSENLSYAISVSGSKDELISNDEIQSDLYISSAVRKMEQSSDE